MITSKNIFSKRREGQLDEAYQMALQRMGDADKDEWDEKAFGWCLIDLIKRDVSSGNQANLGHYRQQLESIYVAENDEVLTKQRQVAISLCNPSGQLANEARQLSKVGRHEQAAAIYRSLLRDFPYDNELGTSLGWELYRLSKKLLVEEKKNLYDIKRNLNEYLKLGLEKPSLLHSLMLQIASRCAGDNNLNIMVFSRLWGLEYLRSDDWERFTTDDKKELPSLAERVIQQASKEASKSNDKDSLNYILPFLERAIIEHPDNIWLDLNKAKVLLGLGRNAEALKFAIDVTRSKDNDYWRWELLGDVCINSDYELSLSCYCKALLCYPDDRFSGKVRMKLVAFLVERGLFPEAKYEINHVIESKNKDGYKIPIDAERFVSQSWYAETISPQSNEEFYRQHKTAAEDLLFSQIPWVSANLGDVFTIPGKENKPRRRVYIRTAEDTVEVVVPEGKFAISDLKVGDAIFLKGEWDSKKRFQVYLVSNREKGEPWDVFSEKIGVVDHVNKNKKLIHFIVSKKIDGVVPFSELSLSYSEGDAVSVRLAKYVTNQGVRYRTVTLRSSSDQAPESLRKIFHEEVRVTNEFGFTESDIFVPPPLLKELDIHDGEVINGVALLTFNKKRNAWGFKAISAQRS